ncbi:hypothetical protein NPX13_g7038 [Xylaria arbuscula]|uniref:Uncharacterized protein n=1 Tax=Xylaria arbuscula TaxID=114810 RepID=A0A9W8NAQ3_9PEZI|nr:hypothetical protein NPX13_g7038 [Xylaria arbuscula]
MQRLKSNKHREENFFAGRKLTFQELGRLLRNDPMPSIDIHELEPREEAADDGYGLVGDVFALRAADEQRRLLEAPLVRVAEGEIAQVIKILAEDI